MTRLTRPILLGSLLALALFFLPLRSSALPIKVSDRDAVQEMMRPQPQFVATRAGWNGPEADPQRRYNPTYERLSPQMTAWRVRNTIARATVPDWRIIVAIALTVVFVRIFAQRMHDEGIVEQDAPRQQAIDGREAAEVIAFPQASADADDNGELRAA